MDSLYKSPLRVYLCIGLLALIGIYSGANLPVSLFPNSSKPSVGVALDYGSATAEEFLNAYGKSIEQQLGNIIVDDFKVEKLTADYRPTSVRYNLEFEWGTDAKEAVKDTKQVMNSFAARLPEEVRDSLGVWNWNRNAGFLALSFFSDHRTVTEIYDTLDPILSAKLAKVEDAEEVNLWNPDQEEVVLEIIPEKLAAYQLFPRDIESAVRGALTSRSGGSISVGPNTFQIQIPRLAKDERSLGDTLLRTPSGQWIHLSDVAKIDVTKAKSNSRGFKTSGNPSLILFATPKSGGNVKRMSEEILQIVKDSEAQFPKDIHYKSLVDPSEFIRNAVNNVAHEVILGAFLAVLVLFLFIGSFRNVATTAIEIPLSMVLAFILMRLSGMNLNIISLGGLALSAGMNVDASIVVMENIFRHFEGVKGPIPFEERLRIIVKAVREVRFPVIAATIASLVVFVPLSFTSALSDAILGDLAKTVVFSHGFSAFVALILVPTVRLQLMGREKNPKPIESPINKQLLAMENFYANSLNWFIHSARAKFAACVSLVGVLALLIVFVLPTLPKEIIGLPDTDWVILGVNASGNTISKQMESAAAENEMRVLDQFGDKISYTFTQIQNANTASIMARLKDKSDMLEVWKGLEKSFENTPFIRYWVVPWNPAELPIPDPPHLRVVIRGGTSEERALATTEIRRKIIESEAFPNVWSEPNTGHNEDIVFSPYSERWALLQQSGSTITLADIADLTRVATRGRTIGEITLADKTMNVFINYPENSISTPEEIGAIPLGFADKLIPLKALGDVSIREVPPLIYREDSRSLFLINAKQNKGDESKIESAQATVQNILTKWTADHQASSLTGGPTVAMEDPFKDRNDAIEQLTTAIALSILLIFLTLVIQFGSVVNSLLVLVSVPFGIIGVILSLWVFGSTISLNSALGVILLNGIAVANSIILVDFIIRLVDQGMDPKAAAVVAARKRMRPILITSLTTLLGMSPIAFGMGDGGRILQPLGIAVTGGLWISMCLTLFVVPALQVAWLEWQQRRRSRTAESAIVSASAVAESQDAIAEYGFNILDRIPFSTDSAPDKKSRRQNSPFDEKSEESARKSEDQASEHAPLENAFFARDKGKLSESSEKNPNEWH